MNKLQIKQLSESAALPTRAHATDAGLDIFAAESVVLKPQQKYKLKTGIAVNIPAGYVGFLTSRSGVSSKTDLVIETGKIDAGFTGEMKINIKNDAHKPEHHILQNNHHLEHSYEPLLYDVKGEKVENGNPFSLAEGKTYLINEGDKIAQLVIVPIVTPQLEIVDQFDSQSDRGTNGFGSTDYDDNSKALELGQLLKFARENKGMTMVELSKELNVSQPYLSSLENGKSGVPKPKTLKKYSTALSIPYDKLLIKAGYVDRHLVDTDEVHR